jgi:hypothetical protein
MAILTLSRQFSVIIHSDKEIMGRELKPTFSKCELSSVWMTHNLPDKIQQLVVKVPTFRITLMEDSYVILRIALAKDQEDSMSDFSVRGTLMLMEGQEVLLNSLFELVRNSTDKVMGKLVSCFVYNSSFISKKLGKR